jgi:hypothetical protein
MTRQELQAISIDPLASPEQKQQATALLNQMNASASSNDNVWNMFLALRQKYRA